MDDISSVSQTAQGQPANPLSWARQFINFITTTALHLLITYPILSSRRILSQTYHHIFGFKYTDRITAHHIRLIRLPSSSSSKALTIQTFPLDACPPYLALSYTWGPALSFETPYTRHDRRPISLNGRPFLVLRNLYFALVQLCESRPGEYVWVDSICINQDSLGERAAQVGIMDRVYDGAEATLIWLGPETEMTEKAVEVLKKLANGAEEKILNWTTTQTLGDVYIADDPALLAKNNLPALTATDWSHLADIFTRTWFGRVWMIQEVALSRRPTVLIGPHELPWDAIGYTADVMGLSNATLGLLALESGPRHLELVMGVVHAVGLQLMREWSRGEESRFRDVADSHDFAVGMKKGEGESLMGILLRLLVGSNGFRATYRRDRIYGLIGIANHVSRQKGLPPLKLDIDYHSSDEAVLTSLGVRFFRETQSLHLLSLAGLASRATESSMASWIPTFENVHAPLLGPNYSNLRPFNASAENAGGFTIDEETHTLHVRAASPNLGSIEELGEKWAELLAGDFLSCIKILLHCGKIYTPTSEPIVEAFWRTLILDHDASRRPAPSPIATSFAAWMKLITLSALSKSRRSNNFLFDLFDSLEPLWVLGNTRDTTKLLPNTDDMFPLLCSLDLIDNPDVPKMSEEERIQMTTDLGKIAAPYEALLKLTLLPNRRLARTVRGYLCLVPWKAEIGDRVMVVAGCPTPLVLRRVKEVEDCYQMIGDAYVHGAMFGEHVQNDCAWRDISLA